MLMHPELHLVMPGDGVWDHPVYFTIKNLSHTERVITQPRKEKGEQWCMCSKYLHSIYSLLSIQVFYGSLSIKLPGQQACVGRPHLHMVVAVPRIEIRSHHTIGEARC